jgi:GDP-D-mannose dehydratase
LTDELNYAMEKKVKCYVKYTQNKTHENLLEYRKAIVVCHLMMYYCVMQSYEPNKETVQVVHPTGDAFSWLDQVRVAGPSKRLYLVATVSLYGIGILPTFMRQLAADPLLAHVR